MKERLRERLMLRAKARIESDGLTPAAVLLLVFERDGRPYVVVTKRTDEVEHHKGQISFPGGARQPEDATLVATALRETSEEIGVREWDVEIVGELDDFATISQFLVSPFVGVIPHPYRFRPQETEVAEVIEVPLDGLSEDGEEDGEKPPPIYRYGGHVIWGATARILQQFLAAVDFGEAHGRFRS